MIGSARASSRWPRGGRHILGHFDEETVVVYQAFAPATGRFAAENGWLGGTFSYAHMCWIKPHFLWMMFRCGWASKPDQRVVLAVHLAQGVRRNSVGGRSLKPGAKVMGKTARDALIAFNAATTVLSIRDDARGRGEIPRVRATMPPR